MGENMGVIGASGRLGRLIVKTGVRHGFDVTAFASQPSSDWPDGTRFVRLTGTDGGLLPEGAPLDVVMIAAPVTSNELHRRCLSNGIHVVDVGIAEDHVRACLALADEARERDRCLVAMAGLAPGLTGLLGMRVCERHPDADVVDVTLVQSARGTAGDQGTRDMLDLLTDRRRAPLTEQPVNPTAGSAPTGRPAFALASPETAFLERPALSPVIRYHTRFDVPAANWAIRALSASRRAAPPAYRQIRNRLARRKAEHRPPTSEVVLLVAVASRAGHIVLGGEHHTFVSDYSATAAAATSLARLACAGALTSGSGHPASMTTWDVVMASACMRAVTILA